MTTDNKRDVTVEVSEKDKYVFVDDMEFPVWKKLPLLLAGSLY